jgi:hypothetical protein
MMEKDLILNIKKKVVLLINMKRKSEFFKKEFNIESIIGRNKIEVIFNFLRHQPK